MSDDLPDADNPDIEHTDILVERIPFAMCAECGGLIVVRVWAEGIDSEVWCEECDEEVIWR